MTSRNPSRATNRCGTKGTLFIDVDIDPSESAVEARFFCERAMDPTSGILGITASGHPEADGFERHRNAAVPHIRYRPNLWPPKNQVALA